MPKACDVKRGDIVSINGAPHIIEQIDISTPTARGGNSLYRMRFRNLATKHKLDATHKGDDALETCHFERRAIQFSYKQGDNLVFMDDEDYSEISFRADDIEYERGFLHEELEGLQALVSDGRILGLELPPVSILQIEQCDPSIRGASATARTKPATLSTGLVVQVPEYLASGEMIRVDTKTAKFLGRAN